jgi:Leucine-rich repeat (LRR) protein
MTDAEVETVASQLSRLPNLMLVKLGDLSKESVKALMAAAPDVVFDYTFEFFGETLTTASEEVKLANVKIGDDNEAEVRLALDLLTNCKRLVLDNCHMSDEVLAKIRDDYRGRTKVVWRVWFGGGSSLTDAEVIRCTYDLVDDNCEDLYYCEDVRFVDFGHNEWLDSCDFIAGMKSLEYCILSGAPIKSLEPFANCKNLKFLEVAFCEYVESVEPLKNCENLQMLNISNTHALDLAPLDNLPLTHFCARTNPSGKSRIAAEEQARFVEQHPDCWTSFEGAQPYGVGWRYDEDEITPLAHYVAIQEAFRYPHAPNNTGWYLNN